MPRKRVAKPLLKNHKSRALKRITQATNERIKQQLSGRRGKKIDPASIDRKIQSELTKFRKHASVKLRKLQYLRELVRSGRWISDFETFRKRNFGIRWRGHEGFIDRKSMGILEREVRSDSPQRTATLEVIQGNLLRGIDGAIINMQADISHIDREEYVASFRELYTKLTTNPAELTKIAEKIFRNPKRSRIRANILELSIVDAKLFEKVYHELMLLPLAIYSETILNLEKWGVKIDQEITMSRWMDRTKHTYFELGKSPISFGKNADTKKAAQILREADKQLTFFDDILSAFHNAVKYKPRMQNRLKEIPKEYRDNIRAIIHHLDIKIQS